MKWASGIAARRGRNKAAVAMASKLARIMYAMLRDNTKYEVKAINLKIALIGLRIESD